MNDALFQNTVNARQGDWGNAALTQTEVDILFEMRRRTDSWEKVAKRILEGTHMFPEHFQDMVIGDVEGRFLEAAVAHACSVAVGIYNDTGRTPDASIWSYTTKNRAYRAVKKAIRISGKATLHDEWVGEEIKKPDEVGKVKIIRPAGGTLTLRGIEKVEVYWPCQLFKTIEAMMVHSNDIELEDEQYKKVNSVYMQTLEKVLADSISCSNNLHELTINFFIKATEALKELGFSIDVISKIMIAGYSPSEPLKEHGQYTKIIEIWTEIISRVKLIDTDLSNLLFDLSTTKIRSVVEMQAES